MTKKVAIVTAASQGIGKACAEALHQKGYQLILMARSEAIIEESFGQAHCTI